MRDVEIKETYGNTKVIDHGKKTKISISIGSIVILILPCLIM